MSRAGAGADEAAILRIYEGTIGPLYAFVSRRVGGDRSLAEDLVQETWMRAVDAWRARGLPDEPLAWLVQVARNALVSHFRRIRPEAVDPAVIDLTVAAKAPEDPDTAALIGWGLARLRRAHADVLEAFYFDGCTVQEIATKFGMSERAVEGRLRRAREKLRHTLSPLMRPRTQLRTNHEHP